MSEVVSFRPTAEERRLIESVRKRHGYKTRAEALRYLLREGATKERKKTRDPLLDLEIPGLLPDGQELTSDYIDEVLYGDLP